LFLLLIKHHLFDYRASVPVQVTQFAILRLNLLRVDLGVPLANAVPPILPIYLRKIDLQEALALIISFNAPKGVINLDWLAKIAVD